eukprot:SAG31_NODE_30409_length_381_cov_1.269504_1_plen_36_part_10
MTTQLIAATAISIVAMMIGCIWGFFSYGEAPRPKYY